MRKVAKKQRDRQRTLPVGQCSRCGREFYPGTLCWRIAGMTLCEACFGPWIQEELAAYRLPAEEVTL